MELKKFTVRIHPILWDQVQKLLEKTIDVTGFQHTSMNHWITIAIKEKIEKDKITKNC